MDTGKLIGCKSTHCYGDKQKIKMELVVSILRHFLPPKMATEHDISLSADSLGSPRLSTSLPVALDVSFSYCRDRIWAVIALDYPIGIDVENKESFSSSYPLSRVFSKREQLKFSEIAACRSSAAAALWTCKEAVAKSMKSGFNTIDPRDLSIGKIKRIHDRFYIEILADRKYSAVVEEELHCWRSIAGPCPMSTENCYE